MSKFQIHILRREFESESLQRGASSVNCTRSYGISRLKMSAFCGEQNTER